MTTTSPLPRPAGAAGAGDLARRLQDALNHTLRGKPEAVRTALVAILSGGHLLIEDVPGVGKTLLAKAIARTMGGSFRRIQGTPDLMPTDITGVRIYDRERATWRFHPGPIFGNVVVFDEINRATPRTQAALLEAMEEGQVTAEGTTYPLPSPFVVVATQNPQDHAGTFPLVEGQRDRFAALLTVGLPHRVAEREVLSGRGGSASLDALVPVADPDALGDLVGAVAAVHCAPAIIEYVLDLVGALREAPNVRRGPSPRASLALLSSARAHALLAGRHFVTPDDVTGVAVDALAHRLALRADENLAVAREAVAEVIGRVPAPRP